MSELKWDGGVHEFRLGIGELRALQSVTDSGPLAVLMRLVGSQWFVDDVVETVRLGLVGGGMLPEDARKTVDKVFSDDSPAIYRHVIVATRILKDSLMGEPGDPVGEPGETEPAPTS